MKNLLWLISGASAALAVSLIVLAHPQQPVEQLAHKLEEAWADHHTTV